MDNKKRNKGFSLIEVIVTIAIMAVVTGATISIYSWTRSAQLKETTNGINDAISELRSVTLSKNGRYRLWIYNEAASKKNYVVIQKYNLSTSNWDEYSKKAIGKKPSVYCEDLSGNKYNIENNVSGNQIFIEFNKSDGSFVSAKCIAPSGTNIDIDEIKVAFGDNTKEIKMIKLTGKHYIK